jgi:putative transposase
MSKYWAGAHTKHKLMVHIVWLPKYRKRILKGALAMRIEELLRECAECNDWQIVELNIQLDHVHMILQFKPDISISKIVQLFKGKSSIIVRREFKELKEVYWGKSFWGDGFFVETVGHCDLKTIKNYVKNQ